MKKLMLLLTISGSCLIVAAQTPDTTRQQQWNNGTPPDTTMVTPPVVPVETVPPATLSPDTMTVSPVDTMNMAPAQPVNTDVRNNDPMADTVSMKTTAQPAADSGTVVVPAPAPVSSDTAVTVSTAVRSETVPAQGTMPSQQTATTGNLPRGVNIPEAVTLTTGLGKWSALPMLNTFVPDDVVNKLKTEHGEKLYDITMLKTGENQYAYSARVQENGVYSTVIVNGDSTGVNQ